jgi:hypothetical protein
MGFKIEEKVEEEEEEEEGNRSSAGKVSEGSDDEDEERRGAKLNFVDVTGKVKEEKAFRRTKGVTCKEEWFREKTERKMEEVEEKEDGNQDEARKGVNRDLNGWCKEEARKDL